MQGRTITVIDHHHFTAVPINYQPAAAVLLITDEKEAARTFGATQLMETSHPPNVRRWDQHATRESYS